LCKVYYYCFFFFWTIRMDITDSWYITILCLYKWVYFIR
jgi:hypothetical protein